VGVRLGVIQKHSGVAGYIIDAGTINLNDLAQIPVHLLQVYHRLSTASAAAMNGVDDFHEKILAIGMGALGSQIFNNLMRSGFGRWQVVDCEVLLAHNCARHLLGEWAVGRNKAEAMVELTNAIFYDSQVAEAIPADVLNPGPHKETFEKCYGCADFVFDFSASIAVSRRLATTQSPARHLSAFMSPRGRTLVITAEDSERTVRLDWLEMLHYRAVLNEPNLRDTLLVQDAYLRYGTACSDVSGELAQDTTAIWAGVASRGIKQIVAMSSPALHIYCSKPDGSTALFAQQVTALVSVRLDEWTIHLDSWLIAKIGSLREAKLPNETGGILLGHFDTYHRICSLVDIVPSPSDSVEWPTSYIRGCAGLPAKVADAETHTMGRIGYVGEWHSHPRGATLQPSADDLEAYSWLITHMQTEALPAIMVIAGDDSQLRLVTDEHY
jgi:hypothetical protein